MALKILWKTMIILLVAGMIAGGFYLLVSRSPAFSAIQANDSIRFEQRSHLPGPDASVRSSLPGRPEFGRRDFEEGRGRSGSLVAWLEIARNLGLIFLITFVVVGFQWVLKKLRRRPAH